MACNTKQYNYVEWNTINIWERNNATLLVAGTNISNENIDLTGDHWPLNKRFFSQI